MQEKSIAIAALNYEEYAAWHVLAESQILEPARLAAVRLLNEHLDDKVDAIDRSRFRISASRVKRPQRAFSKLSREKYRDRFTTYEDVPDLLDDLIGVRIVCNNLSDINTFQEIIGELPVAGDEPLSLAVEKASHRDYFAQPKASGYRAFHVNLVVPVPRPRETKHMRVEVQVRTLLQDGWGELTHEDTYKPGSTVPDWIVAMSLRMAELLAAVDNIAQDLRTGLDVETQRAVEDTPNTSDVAYVASGESAIIIPTPGPDGKGETKNSDKVAAMRLGNAAVTEIEAALLREAREMVEQLRRPIPIALLSQNLIAKFGNEITSIWTRRGGFKSMLKDIAPDAPLTGPPPGYLHPIGAVVPDDWSSDSPSPDKRENVPALIRALRTYDKGLPILPVSRIQQVTAAVAEAATARSDTQNVNGHASLDQINDLAIRAREIAEERGQLVVRPHAQYVLQLLNRNALIGQEIDVHRVRRVLLNWIVRSSERNGLMTDELAVRAELEAWLGLDPNERSDLQDAAF